PWDRARGRSRPPALDRRLRCRDPVDGPGLRGLRVLPQGEGSLRPRADRRDLRPRRGVRRARAPRMALALALRRAPASAPAGEAPRLDEGARRGDANEVWSSRDGTTPHSVVSLRAPEWKLFDRRRCSLGEDPGEQ